MSSIKVIQRLSKTNSKGESPLVIRITEHRKTSMVWLGIYIQPDDWDPAASKVKKSHRNSGRLNTLIATKVAEAEGTLVDLKTKAKSVTAKRVKAAIKGEKPTDFFLYAEKYLQSLKDGDQVGTYRRANTVINKFKSFVSGGSIAFEDLSHELLTSYGRYLTSKLNNAPITVHSNYRVLKKVVHDAIKDQILSRDRDPFLNIKVKIEASSRAYLIEEELIKIENLDLDDSKRIGVVRDMFVFACYAGGIRVSDLITLRWTNISDERLVVTTQKTGGLQVVKLPGKAMTILSKYGGESFPKKGFIFPFVTSESEINTPQKLHTMISRKTTLINKVLKEIAEKAEITKRLSFHVSRHTFATMALRRGIRMEYVSKLLGHANLKETQVYAKIINEELDKAMEAFNN